MAQRGRPIKKPVSERIEAALGAASQEIQAHPDPEEQEVEIIQPGQTKEITKISKTTEVSAPKKLSQDVEDDYNFARDNLRDLLKRGKKILDGISNLANETDHPRAYEVAGNVLKILIEGNRELLTHQKNLADLEKNLIKTSEDKNVNIDHADSVNNIICTGTTQEMLDALAEVRKKKLEQEQGE